jgi:hypothetical protein
MKTICSVCAVSLVCVSDIFEVENVFSKFEHEGSRYFASENLED